MAITTTKSGTADNNSITAIQIVREPSGNLQVEVYYKVGETGKQLTLEPSAGFKSAIEGTYTEIKNAINTAEGIS